MNPSFKNLSLRSNCSSTAWERDQVSLSLSLSFLVLSLFHFCVRMKIATGSFSKTSREKKVCFNVIFRKWVVHTIQSKRLSVSLDLILVRIFQRIGCWLRWTSNESWTGLKRNEKEGRFPNSFLSFIFLFVLIFTAGFTLHSLSLFHRVLYYFSITFSDGRRGFEQITPGY